MQEGQSQCLGSMGLSEIRFPGTVSSLQASKHWMRESSFLLLCFKTMIGDQLWPEALLWSCIDFQMAHIGFTSGLDVENEFNEDLVWSQVRSDNLGKHELCGQRSIPSYACHHYLVAGTAISRPSTSPHLAIIGFCSWRLWARTVIPEG